jgi:C-terminal processing protease CtpA/Prc
MKWYRPVVFIFLIAVFCVPTALGQKFDSIERSRFKAILKNIKVQIRKTYYDPNFHGIDLDARFQKADARLDQVTNSGQAIGVIAQALIDFNDSHLYFLPPRTNTVVQYPWQMAMIGEKCFITSVKPKSDAEKKGVNVGDQLISIEGFQPSRSELWKVLYYYNVVSKRDRVNLTLLAPGAAEPRVVEVNSEVKTQPQKITYQTAFRLYDDFFNEENNKQRFSNYGNVGVWRMPSFEFEPGDVPAAMAEFKGKDGLIIDLRGNGGGYVVTMEALTGRFFDKDIKVANLVGRKKMDPSIAKTAGPRDIFRGKLIVLLDSQSASASEVFARVVQLEKRGTVLGDVSAGAVMQSIPVQGELGMDTVVFYGISITNADLIMADGKSLEHTGVIPDELVLPTGEDMAKRRDPVLARALELLGVKMSPEEAGKIFPAFLWK